MSVTKVIRKLTHIFKLRSIRKVSRPAKRHCHCVFQDFGVNYQRTTLKFWVPREVLAENGRATELDIYSDSTPTIIFNGNCEQSAKTGIIYVGNLQAPEHTILNYTYKINTAWTLRNLLLKHPPIMPRHK